MLAILKNKFKQKGFTLIELLVAIFIFSIIIVGIVSVFASSANAYQKAQAIKSVRDNMEYAMSSIAKEVRMGKIENGNNYATGSASNYLLVSKNQGGRICYRINATSIGSVSLASGDNCADAGLTYSNIVDLSNSDMSFDANSQFRSCLTDSDGTGTLCNGTIEKRRGWMEINMNVNMKSGSEMSTDQVNVQTIVSSRDYGWQDITP